MILIIVFFLCLFFKTLGVASFPYIAVLAPQGSVQTVAVVFRHSGPLEADTLIRELLQRMEIHSQITNDIQQTRSAEEAQREQARMLREQQDQEYEESLLMDRGLKEAQVRSETKPSQATRVLPIHESNSQMPLFASLYCACFPFFFKGA